MSKLCIAAVLLFLFAGDLALAQEQVTARHLVRTIDSALGGLASAASEPRGGLAPKDPNGTSFWSTLNGLRIRVLMIESALARRDAEFFTLLDQGSTDLGALRVAWARAGVKNEQANQNLRIAATSYRMLRANYGREGVRLRRGGGLSEAEQRQLQRLQRTQRRLAESLRALRERVRRDPVTVSEIDRFRAEAERIVLAPASLESYLNALIASSEIRGEWEANTPYLKQEAPEDFVVANEMVEDLYVESDIGHVFTVDLGEADSLDFLDDEVTVAEDAEEGDRQVETEAVQIYELGDESVSGGGLLVETGVPRESVEVLENRPAEDEIVEEDLDEDAQGEGVQEDVQGEEDVKVEEVEIEDVQIVEPVAVPADEQKKETGEAQEEGAKDESESEAPVPATEPHPNRPPIS